MGIRMGVMGKGRLVERGVDVGRGVDWKVDENGRGTRGKRI